MPSAALLPTAAPRDDSSSSASSYVLLLVWLSEDQQSWTSSLSANETLGGRERTRVASSATLWKQELELRAEAPVGADARGHDVVVPLQGGIERLVADPEDLCEASPNGTVQRSLLSAFQ